MTYRLWKPSPQLQLLGGSGRFDGFDRLAFRVEDPDSTGGGYPDVSAFVCFQAVRTSRLIRLQVGENPAIREARRRAAMSNTRTLRAPLSAT